MRGLRRAVAALGIVAVSGCAALQATLATSRALPPGLTGHVVTVIPTSQHVVALTFDAGAGAQAVKPILTTLAANGVRATFFLTGTFVRTHPKLTARIAAAGHVLGTHTLTHPHLTQLSDTDVRREVRRGAAALADITGISPLPWFRFPFGEYDGRTLRIVNGLGYAAIGWTVDTLGWAGTERTTAEEIVTRVTEALTPGAIVLMHVGANPDDGSTLDADALPGVISAVQSAGYGFTTVRRLLRTG